MTTKIKEYEFREVSEVLERKSLQYVLRDYEIISDDLPILNELDKLYILKSNARLRRSYYWERYSNEVKATLKVLENFIAKYSNKYTDNILSFNDLVDLLYKEGLQYVGTTCGVRPEVLRVLSEVDIKYLVCEHSITQRDIVYTIANEAVEELEVKIQTVIQNHEDKRIKG